QIASQRDAEVQKAASCLKGSGWSDVVFTKSQLPMEDTTGTTHAGYNALYHGTDRQTLAHTFANCLAVEGFHVTSVDDHTIQIAKDTEQPNAATLTPQPT